MGKATIILIAMISVLSASTGNSKPSLAARSQLQVNETNQPSGIDLTIATVGPMLGPPTDHYTVGEQVLITISMTNRSSQSTYACVSSDFYQDLPKLTKNGQLIPYTKWETDLLRNTRNEQTCERDDLPEKMLLKANEPTVVDFLVLVDDLRLPTGAQAWYDPLKPGVYEMSMQRRNGCCDGPMIESNKIRFEIVP
ncbi:MAG: hypothetical protein JWM21_3151 [Acidobacteria bacterium]|nr:hypothetical protein [Acidobacteriota bacterium]